MKKALFASYAWPVVVETNRRLCEPKAALHKPSSDGYEAARDLWESTRNEPMDLAEAADLCRRCHRLAPFCNYNGNTFVAIIRQIVAGFPLAPDQAALVRSLAGHIVAGIAAPDEEAEFQRIVAELTGSGFDSLNPPD